MKLPKRLLSAVMTLLVLAACTFYVPAHIAGAGGTSSLFSDGNTQFFQVKACEDATVLYLYRPTGKYEAHRLEQMCFEECLPYRGGVLLAGNRDGMILLTAVGGSGKKALFLEQTSFLPGCIAVTDRSDLYLTDTADSKTVRRYEALTEERSPLRLPEKVQALFLSVEARRVYAVGEAGVYDAETGAFTACEVPDFPVSYSGGYYTDNQGTVFSFDETAGFQERLKVGYSLVCTTKQAVFALEESENTVLMFNFDGQLLGTYRCNSMVRSMKATSGRVGLLTDRDEVIFVGKEVFEAVEATPESTPEAPVSPAAQQESHHDFPEDSRPTSNTSVPDAAPKPMPSLPDSEKAEASEFPSFGSEYRLEGEWLLDVPPGTTVAKLKQDLCSGNKTLTATDHHGKRGADGKVGTGWRLEILKDGEEKNLTVVVLGDVTGEGNVNANDLRILSNALNDVANLTEAARLAADLDHNGMIGVGDLFLLQEFSDEQKTD